MGIKLEKKHLDHISTKNNNLDNTNKELLKSLKLSEYIYLNKNITKEDILNIENIVDDNNRLKEMLGKKIKSFKRILRELAQNAYDHSIINDEMKSELYLEIVLDEYSINIITKNYFQGGQGKDKKISKLLENTNNLNYEKLKNEYKKKLESGVIENNGQSGAGLGILDVAKKIKKYKEGKIFEYNIIEADNKNKIYKLNLKTKFPL